MTDKSKSLLPIHTHIQLLETMCDVTYQLVKFRNGLNANIHAVPGLLKIRSCRKTLQMTASLMLEIDKLKTSLAELSKKEKLHSAASATPDESVMEDFKLSRSTYEKSASALEDALVNLKSLLIDSKDDDDKYESDSPDAEQTQLQ